MIAVSRARSEGFDAVEDMWQRFVPSARLQRPAVDGRAELEWTSIEVEGLSVVGYELTGQVQSAIQPEGQLLACRVATRDGWVGSGRRRLDATQPWLCGNGTAQSGWQGKAIVRAMVFDTEYAQEIARQISGDDGLVLSVTDAAPRSRAAGIQWERAYQYAQASLGSLSAAEPEAMIVAELRRHALRTTLLSFPTTFLASVERTAQRRPAPSTVRRAMAFMDAHAHEPITIDDVAVAARISTRGLQAAFHRATGTTPSEYLRAVRLSGAHEELTSGGSETVAEIARRWGFNHPSRFAAYYRARYGRPPFDAARHS